MQQSSKSQHPLHVAFRALDLFIRLAGIYVCRSRPIKPLSGWGVQGVTRPKHGKLHGPGVHFSTPQASCTILCASDANRIAAVPILFSADKSKSERINYTVEVFI